MSATSGITARTPIEHAPGVAGRRAPVFRRLGVETVGDLVRYLPTRHEFEAEESSVKALVPDAVGTARGEVTATRVALRGMRRFEAVLTDDTERLDLVWFNQAFLRDKIRPGMRIRVQGLVKRRGPGLQMANPRWEALLDESREPTAREARLRPVYAATEEMGSREIERVIGDSLGAVLPQIEDHLSPECLRTRQMPALAEAYRMMHAPRDEGEAKAGRRRLAYDELLLLQLGLLMRRAERSATRASPALRWSEAIDARIRARLPFALTKWQDEAVREVAKDLSRKTPANRLIQGDVGSGKTVVALYAMLMAAAGKRQSALMAPTTLLAEQHFSTFQKLLEGSKVRLALLTGATPPDERKNLLARLSAGEIDALIGTHALVTESVRFASLAVVVIDEQHRFGVHQRARLRERPDDAASSPHTLVMTATPIPRTLALTFFGDLDVTTIRGLPPGRTPVVTRVVAPDKRADVYTYIRKRLEKGEQAYIVAPAIEGGGEEAGSGATSVRALLAELERGALKGLRLAAMHGRLKRETREKIMDRFRRGEIDALVTTTVIEVGVDVPNASVMVIEGAERFGLAQLHQLRGRVGRGRAKAVCALIASATTPDAERRLEAVGATTDGFRLAEVDLELRGPGDTVGARQSGAAPFRVAQFPRDTDLLLMARRDATAWIARSPKLAKRDEALVRARVIRAMGAERETADVA